MLSPAALAGFAPGRHAIEGYGQGGFRFGGLSHVGSILALPSGVRAWPVAALADLSEEVLRPLLDEAGAIDVVLIGTGRDPAALPRALREALRGLGLSVDAMATPAAAATYNVLLSENRRVAAALIAVP